MPWDMDRRVFIRTTLAGLSCLPGVAWIIAASRSRREISPDWFFFDDRFPEAEKLARSPTSKVPLTAVQGDMTALWNTELRQSCLRRSLSMQGVTTESFFFCLKGMLNDHARVDAEETRVSGDLLLWRIHSTVITA